jgi:prepilin-type processing-associated H-X9-DG protein
MGCIDYMGIAGPNKGFLNNSANPQKYKKQQGVLIDLVDLIENGRPPTRVRHRDLTDGVSHTMMVAESTTRSVWFDPEKKPQAKWELSGAWASGENISHIEHPINAINATGLPDGTETEEVLVDGEIRTRRIEPEEEIYSDHPGGAHLLFADASVHFASSDTPTRVLAALATRSGTKNWGENPHPSADDVE